MRGQTKRQTKPSAPMMALPNWIKKRGASSLEMDDDVHTHAKKVRYIGRCLVKPVDRMFNAAYMHHFLTDIIYYYNLIFAYLFCIRPKTTISGTQV